MQSRSRDCRGCGLSGTDGRAWRKAMQAVASSHAPVQRRKKTAVGRAEGNRNVREEAGPRWLAVLVRLVGLMRNRPCVGPVLIGPGHDLVFMGPVACCFGPNSWALSPPKKTKRNKSYTIR